MAAKIAPRKRPKSYYTKRPAKKPARGKLELSVGMKGILITTGDKEKLCVSEAYNLLNEFADELYGPEFSVSEPSSSDDEDSTKKTVSGEEDVEESIAEEVKALKGETEKKRERRFQSVLSGAKNVVFIECRAPVDPIQLVHRILSDVKATGMQKTRFCQRLIPVTEVCRANMKDIQQHLDPVLRPHFHNSTDPLPVEFAVHYKCRNNQSLQREKVIRMVASSVTDDGAYPHTVNLKNPELVVCVEIVKTLCCLSVVKDFNLLRQYNIQMISEDAAKAKPTGSPESHSLSDSKELTETTRQPEEPVQPTPNPDKQDRGQGPSEARPHSGSPTPQSQPTPED